MKKIVLASALLTIFSLSILFFQMVSCKKSNAQPNCPPATYPVSGLWEGTYQTNQVTHPATYTSMVIFPDGSFTRRSKVVGTTNDYGYTRGRWTLNGTAFEYRDTTILYSGGSVVETGSLTFKNDGTFSAGTWQNISGQTYTGTFQNMKRVN